MLKQLWIALALTACSFSAYSQTEKNDSTLNTAQADSVQQLDEIVVEGRTQRVVKFGVEYIPDKQTKRAATDATQLLRQMSIPQLSVDPANNSIKTLAGKSVSMFIDYVPATSQELSGLRPEDVLRVEVLEYPDDPRFNSAQHVVNFIMQQYEWGGYTKLSTYGTTLNQDYISGTVYSKFVYKKWTYDIYADGGWDHSDKLESSTTESFRDLMVGGRHYDQIQKVSSGGHNYLDRSNSQWINGRAVYRTDSIYLQHSFYLARNRTPFSRNDSEMHFSPDLFSSSSSVSRSSSLSMTPCISGYYQFTMPKGNSIVASWDVSFPASTDNSWYSLGDLDPITNGSRVRVFSPDANIAYSQKLGHGNTLRTSLITSNTIYNTRYSGSFDGKQKMISSENMLFLEYMQNWKFGLSLYSRVGVSYVLGRLDGKTTLSQWNPRLGLQLQWQISDKHNASIDGWWGNSHPSAYSTNTALIQSNELMWTQGNPDLRNTIYCSANASYSFIPVNWFSLSANFSYEGNYDKQATQYFTLPGYDGLISRTINSGDCHSFDAYVSANLKLFNNSLALRATGIASRVILTGCDAQHAGWFAGYFNAAYYLKNFSFSLYYNTRQKMLNGWTSGTYSRYDATYGLNVTYSVGDFKVSGSYRNWFGKGKYYSEFDSPYYSTHGWTWNSWLDTGVNLSLSYTFNYGKKIDHSDELSGGNGKR